MMKSAMSLMTLLLLISIVEVSYAAVLPDVPVPFKNGTGAIDDNGVIYVGLGSAGASWYKLDLKSDSKIWENISNFPGNLRDQAVSVILDNELYVFGGVGKDNESKTLRVFSDVFKYKPTDNTWEKINTLAPIGLTGHAGTRLDKDKALIIGGVNKNIFDNHFTLLEQFKGNQDEITRITNRYFNQEAKDYFFNRISFIYNAKENTWEYAATVPDLGTAGSSLVVRERQVTLVNGEIKPGLRTDIVRHGSWDKNKLQWDAESVLPPLPGDQYQEGLAGAFAGYSHGTLLVAGGANFPGARANYLSGKKYSHENLKKEWRSDVYALANNEWKIIGKLAQPLGYGVAINYAETLYMIGGETTQGKPISSVTALKMANDNLLIE